MRPPDGFVPYLLDRQRLLWVDSSGARFSEPFFGETVARLLRRGRRRWECPLIQLSDLARPDRGPSPRGFIFHMSRCGSTALSRMLSRARANLVISEAEPVNTVLLPRRKGSRAARVREVRAIVQAFLLGRGSRERHAFVKLTSWNVLQLPTILDAFPETPWIFVYRDPLEVMVSLQTRPPGWAGMLSELFDPAELKAEADELLARLLGRFLDAAVAAAALKRGLFLDYRDLSEESLVAALSWCGVALPYGTITRMASELEFYSKDRTRRTRFVRDSATKRREATPRTRWLVDRFVADRFKALERLSQRGAAAG